MTVIPDWRCDLLAADEAMLKLDQRIDLAYAEGTLGDLLSDLVQEAKDEYGPSNGPDEGTGEPGTSDAESRTPNQDRHAADAGLAQPEATGDA